MDLDPACVGYHLSIYQPNQSQFCLTWYHLNWCHHRATAKHDWTSGDSGRFACCLQNTKLKEKKWQLGAYLFIFLWCIALFLHLIPGFNNAKVLDAVVTGPLSVPFTLYLNLDKPLILFGLLLAYPALLGSKANINKKALIYTAIPLFSLLPLAWGLGALKPEFTIPNWWWLFALNNLLLTCVAEEAFFRGFIQQSLSKRFGWIAGVAVASVLFGAAHIGGGLLLAVFATLAGVGYGLAFHYSSRLWVAVAFHFLFNFIHLVFFTYPIMK